MARLLVDMDGHDLDAAHFLMGEVAEVLALGGALVEPELGHHGEHDAAAAILRFENAEAHVAEVTAFAQQVR